MDFRIFMELRKSALLNAPCKQFYGLHLQANTVEDIKNIRIMYLHEFGKRYFWNGYVDEDWQLYFVLMWTAKDEKNKDFIFFDFDSKGWLKDTPPDYTVKNYMQELMRIVTDFDQMGRPKEHPVDITDILIDKGWG